MKQTASLFRSIFLLLLSASVAFYSCSKKNDISVPTPFFAGQYIEEEDGYILKIESKGGNKFQITNFGGFLNVPLEAYAAGQTLKIPSQTFKNPNGKSITLTGTGVLKTINTKDDTIAIEYALSGFTSYESEIIAVRK